MKRLLLVCVLAAALLGLLAAPGFAAKPIAVDPYAGYPYTWAPGVAYVHPWGDPTFWEETDADGNWYGWDTDTLPGPFSLADPNDPNSDLIPWTYKAVPSSYDIQLVCWVFGGPPKGQFVAMPGNLMLDGYLKDVGGKTVWSTTAKAAMHLWGPAFQWPGWTMPTFNKGDQTVWAIAWVYDLGVGNLPTGDYTGMANYRFKHQITDQTLYDPAQKGPIHYGKGVASIFPTFDLTVK